eukprot:scaffold754_cov248-Pinguiococcus_pyrenoidosus.AAC.45
MGPSHGESQVVEVSGQEVSRVQMLPPGAVPAAGHGRVEGDQPLEQARVPRRRAKQCTIPLSFDPSGRPLVFSLPVVLPSGEVVAQGDASDLCRSRCPAPHLHATSLLAFSSAALRRWKRRPPRPRYHLLSARQAKSRELKLGPSHGCVQNERKLTKTESSELEATSRRVRQRPATSSQVKSLHFGVVGSRESTPASTSSKHPCRHQLVDLRLHAGILHRLLCGGRVLLEVANDLHDHRVSQQALDLRVGHGVRKSLLVGPAGRVDRGDDLLEAVAAELVAIIDREALLVRLHGLVVLLHVELDVSFLCPGLHVLLVQLQRLLHAVERAVEVPDLLQRCGKVVSDRCVRWVSLHGLLVFRDRAPKVAGAELFVASALRFLRQFGVHVRLALSLPLLQLEHLHLALDLLVTVLALREMVLLHCLLVVVPRLGDARLPNEGLRQALERSAVRAPDFDRLVAELQRLVVVAHLEVDGRLVVDVQHLAVVDGDGLVVRGQGLLEVLRLVEGISSGLGLLSACDAIPVGLLLLRELHLGLWLWLRRRRWLRFLAGGRLSLWRRRSRLATGEVFRPSGRHAEGELDDLHELRILQSRLHGRRGVGAQHAKLGHEGLVREPSAILRMQGHARQQLRAEELRQRVVGSAGRRLRLRTDAPYFLKSSRERRISRHLLEALRIRLERVVVALQPVKRCALADMALGPRAVQGQALLRVLQRLLRVALAEVRGRAVAEEHLVAGVQSYGLRVLCCVKFRERAREEKGGG